MITSTTTSLEDLRNATFFETQAEFAHRLGITPQTYRRLLQRDGSIENPTKRQVAARVALPPHLISELMPPPSPARIAALTAVIETANATGGWMVLDDDGDLTPAPEVRLAGAPDDR